MPDLAATIKDANETSAILANEFEQALNRFVKSGELTKFRADQLRLIFKRYDRVWRDTLKLTSETFIEMSETAHKLFAEVEQLREEARNR